MSKSHLMVADAVGDLHREHGFWRIAQALFVSAFRRSHSVNSLQDLDDHMLRDIGVEPVDRKHQHRLIGDPIGIDRRRSRL